MSNSPSHSSIQIAITWCLAWGSDNTPQYPLEQFHQWRSAIANNETPLDSEWQQALAQAQSLTATVNVETLSDITALIAQQPALWNSRIGLVYGGVTKVKSYVFESAALQEIRGASALLDRINLVDLPSLFHAETGKSSKTYEPCQQAPHYCQTVRRDTFQASSDPGAVSHIADALIPELIVYATGGKILAFCPAAFTDELSNAIERRYTAETLTANSCAVGAAFRPVEIYCGLLKDPIETTLWHDEIVEKHTANTVLQSYFGFKETDSASVIKAAFQQRKNFGELVGKLTSQFNQRRSGDDSTPLPARKEANAPASPSVRPSRRYPPMFETHPYLMRDGSDIRSMVAKATRLADEPNLSEATARKRRVGQITKRDDIGEAWYVEAGFKAHWNPEPTQSEEEGSVFQSWVSKFEQFLKREHQIDAYDPTRVLFNTENNIKRTCEPTREARSLHEIGDSSNGYVAYIYADGNSMGKYIRDRITTPTGYQLFSQHVLKATEESVYYAIANHIHPVFYQPDAKSSRQPNTFPKAPVWIHPFEIITIGGDDVLLVVPANKAAAVAQAIGQHFEAILLQQSDTYRVSSTLPKAQTNQAHRYCPKMALPSECCLSTSSGVLITSADTPIYYADKLVNQLLKSAKQHLKQLKQYDYYGGTVDFLVLKSVTMITSNIAAFRNAGLVVEPPNRKHRLKLYAAPYTLHELQGLINTVKALKQSSFPKSQLYQIRSLLERGKQTAILNYRYFRVRLADEQQQLIKTHFEDAWCNAGTNKGNIAPWLTAKRHPEDKQPPNKSETTTYETIWRELVELEPFIEATSEPSDTSRESAAQSVQPQAKGIASSPRRLS